MDVLSVQYITLLSAIDPTAQQSPSPAYAVLEAMRGYIANFFTCQYCRKHFNKMAAEIAAMTDKSDAASVLWLWIAHNRVSLHGLLIRTTKRGYQLQSCGSHNDHHKGGLSDAYSEQLQLSKKLIH